MYNTGERFDLFIPVAIPILLAGMTLEQGGIGAGEVVMSNGSI
jgi:hypothetical protein